MRYAPALLMVLLVAATPLVGCGGAGMESYTPVKEQTKYDEDRLLSAAERSMRDLGYRTVQLDRTAHRVSTREKEVGYSSVPRLSYKYSFEVQTTGGKLAIKARCKMNTAMSREKFEDCGDDRPERVVDELEALKEAILKQADKTPPPPKFFEEEAAAQEEPKEGEADAKPEEEAPSDDAEDEAPSDS